MRLCRLSEKGHFKEIEVGALKRYGESAVDHAWLSATRLVVGSSTGALLLFSDGSLQQEIPELPLTLTLTLAVPLPLTPALALALTRREQSEPPEDEGGALLRGKG